MNIPALYAAQPPLSSQSPAPVDAARPAETALIEASRQFEAVFVRKFLGDSLKPLLHQTPGSSGPGAGFYQYLMTDVIARSLTEQDQFGFSSALQAQLAVNKGNDANCR